MRYCRAAIALSALLLACPAAARAHDFWIEPSTCRPAPGELVRFALRVGDGFPGSAFARRATHIERFFAAAPGGGEPTEVVGIEGRDPAGLLRVAGAGALVVAYTSRPSAITLAAGKFRSYLEEEGLERVIEARAAAGESEAPGRELYSRCAKALLTAGAAEAEERAIDRRLGLPLELVAEKDPTRLGAGDALVVRLYFEGEPLAGAGVSALRRRDEGDTPERPPAHARTGADGRATLALDERGFWLVAATHMVRARAGEDADWRSYWASLTFEGLAASDDAPAEEPAARH